MPTLEFKGKQYIYAHHLSVPFRQLNIRDKKSLNKTPSLDDNLIIQGDNLHGLKALLPKYAGKVKCIYIDPPYNTGNEGWCYNDSVNSPLMKEWLQDNANPVDREDLERHDKWLCMMWPRLQLLKELLSQDGIIFMSIDDNEHHNLRILSDEIFGEDNFIRSIPVIKNLKGNNDEFAFAGTHETLLCYARNIETCRVNEFVLDEEEASDWEEDEYGFFKQGANLKATGQNAPREKRQNLFFPLFISDDKSFSLERINKEQEEIYPITDGKEMSWRWSKEKFEKQFYDVIITGSKGSYSIYKKQRPTIGDLPSKKPKSFFYKPEYSTGNGTNLIKAIFGNKKFDTPKPLQFIKDIVFLGSHKDSIILDSFAGSGTTAHAVLSLNKADGGNRKFILIECEDYADKITAERVRRVVNGVSTAKDIELKNGIDGTFTYCELGEPFDIDKILSGEGLPSYDALAQYVFYTATGESLGDDYKQSSSFLIGETDLFEVYLVYKPDLAYLRSNESALNQDKLDIIANHKSGKQKIVFATAKYMSQSELTKKNITFCQIPYAIHKIAGN